MYYFNQTIKIQVDKIDNLKKGWSTFDIYNTSLIIYIVIFDLKKVAQ